jgi:tryptophan synthase alpha chain
MEFASVTTSSDRIATRIATRFAELRAAGRGALVAYVTAGYPDAASSLALLRGMEAAGADVIEIGVPFSDPIADGPIIQASSQRALEQGVTFAGTLELIAAARPRIPVVLFT